MAKQNDPPKLPLARGWPNSHPVPPALRDAAVRAYCDTDHSGGLVMLLHNGNRDMRDLPIAVDLDRSARWNLARLGQRRRDFRVCRIVRPSRVSRISMKRGRLR
jgi:hypothetical protein